MGGKDGVGMARGKAAAGVGRSRLHQYRPALRAARQVQWPFHLVEIAAMVDRLDALGPGILSAGPIVDDRIRGPAVPQCLEDRKSTRLNSSHVKISYAVFCLKKKK